MSSGHEHNGGASGHHDDHGPRSLPASLAAPGIVSAWRMRALIVFAVATIISLLAFSWSHEGRNHLLRAYLLGYMICFSFAGGGLAVLMLQYVSGGKWGLLLRRPLEAMSRTIWVVGLLFVPIIFLWKHLYQWAAYPTAGAVAEALSNHSVSLEQAMTMNAKRAMLNPGAAIGQTVVIFLILGTFAFLLNKWSLQRDADPERGTEPSFDRWRIKFENLSGIGIFIYVILLTDGAIVWIKSLDVTWYSSIWGLQFLVGQGYAVLALGILTVILLSRYEPMKTMLRTTEQYDLGKLAFAFVMLNIYLCFAEFLIIWSGNVPDEIPWYLNRIHGGWWYVCSADFICHWLIPFVLLLSRDLKRNKQKMIWLTSFMIFARCLDMFWLIEPNFADAAGNLHIAGNIGILAYITVPVAVLSLWAWFYMRELEARPLINVNDPHVEEMLEPEHAH
jgi:hypothetical protein